MKKINLALQGGGAHGAYTWGVLDRLLEEDRIEIEGITATSAGAMNAAALKTGWVRDGRDGAKAELAAFWQEIALGAKLPENGLTAWLAAFTPAPALFAQMMEMSPAYLAGDALTRVLSPYQFNPLNIHPLRQVLRKMLDFDKVCDDQGPKLFISATNVRSGKIKVFSDDEITEDALLASACLPTIYQAIEIEDPKTGQCEAYWDGGYMGNPALFPLFYNTKARDIVIVHINPIRREEIPRTSVEIVNRINEISFNSSLLRELRAIDFVHRLIEDGSVKAQSMKDILVHSIMDDELMTQLGVATKLSPDRAFLDRLKEAGRASMDTFLKSHWADIGQRGTVDLKAMFQ